MNTPGDWIILAILLAGAVSSFLLKKLTGPAAFTGACLGWLIYIGDGLNGLSNLAVFFLLGTAATSWKKQQKQGIKGGAAHQPTRNAGQVIANAGIPALLGGGTILFPTYKPLLQLMMAGAIASAMADTLSSELGMIYGRRFFNILTRRPDEKGLDGVISLEGVGIGLAGAAITALIYCLGHGAHWIHGLILLLAGTGGNLFDSLLGALFERRGYLSNNAVNFGNTLTAALIAGALAHLL